MKKYNNCASGWWVILLTATLAVPAIAEANVGLFNASLKQVVTSSTLKWTSLKKEAMNNYIIGAESDQGPLYLCRTRHEGDMLLGQLRPQYTSCAVSASKSYDVFEVLENIENASLITWKTWGKFDSKPSGGVLVDSSDDSVFVGRSKADSGYSHNIGRIAYENFIGQLLTFNDKNDDMLETNGEILIEVEPVSYKLEDVEFDLTTEHVQPIETKLIKERTLQNDDMVGANISTEIEYNFDYTVSWGHGHGIAIGLNTTITLADGTPLSQIEWANPLMEKRKKLHTLQIYLEPGTACNVSFKGTKVKREVQYTGRLITFYNNEEPRSRQIRGERIENTMEVEAIYGDVYFMGNNSFVPTTTTTTTSTTTTTTTTATPTVPAEADKNDAPFQIVKPNQPAEMDSNNLVDTNMEKAVKEPNINQAVVGPLGSSVPDKADMKVISFTLFIPVLLLIL